MTTSSTALRLAAVALLCLAGLTAAGGIGTCPNSDVANVYNNATSPCGAFDTCMSNYCTCQGATGVNSTTGACIWGSSRPSCTVAQNCTTTLVPCLNNAASTTACNVPALTSLRIALMNLAGGAFYNGSSLENACKFQTCRLFNNSVTAADACNLTSAYSAVCTAPYVYIGVMTLSGDWTAILANATAKLLIIASLEADMTKQLGVPVKILDLKSGSLIVTFQAGVSASNPALQAALASAQSSSAWLTNTQAAFTSNGGSGSLTVTGIVAVTTAAPTPSGVTTPATPAPTTASPGGAAWARSSVFAALVAVVAAVVFAL